MSDFDESALDPDLVARLRRRYGDPPPPAKPAAAEILEMRRRRERAAACADPELLTQLEEHDRRAETHRKTPHRVRVDASIARLDLAAWSLSEIGEPAFYEPPDEVRRALHEAAPQALLRDLHRPVRHFGDVALRPSAPPHDPTGERTRELVRSTMRRHFRAQPAAQATASRLGAEGFAELQALLAEPWERALPQEPTRLPGLTPGTEDAQWFGIDGGYDPDQ